MNFKHITAIFLLFFISSAQIKAIAIKHIFVDINALINVSPKAASKVVGIINSMKYMSWVGNIPTRLDFFKALKNIPAESNQVTYNDNLTMPAILSDWLLDLQTNNAIRSTIHSYLEQSCLSEIEKTIFKNVSSMMMNPALFIETQYVEKDIAKILYSLKKLGYTIYIIGNWDKESEPYLMKLLSSNFLPDIRYCYFSHKAKLLKPHHAYFEQMLKYFHIEKTEALIIDVEKYHAQFARNLGFNTILLHGHSANQLKSELNRIGIRI